MYTNAALSGYPSARPPLDKCEHPFYTAAVRVIARGRTTPHEGPGPSCLRYVAAQGRSSSTPLARARVHERGTGPAATRWACEAAPWTCAARPADRRNGTAALCNSNTTKKRKKKRGGESL